MSKVQELKVEAREGRGKGPAYQARIKGLIPAIIYGGAKGLEWQPTPNESMFLNRMGWKE